jgi:hypothetical protein
MDILGDRKWNRMLARLRPVSPRLEEREIVFGARKEGEQQAGAALASTNLNAE